MNTDKQLLVGIVMMGIGGFVALLAFTILREQQKNVRKKAKEKLTLDKPENNDTENMIEYIDFLNYSSNTKNLCIEFIKNIHSKVLVENNISTIDYNLICNRISCETLLYNSIKIMFKEMKKTTSFYDLIIKVINDYPSMCPELSTLAGAIGGLYYGYPVGGSANNTHRVL